MSDKQAAKPMNTEERECPECERVLSVCTTDQGGKALVCFNSSCRNMTVYLVRPAPNGDQTE